MSTNMRLLLKKTTFAAIMSATMATGAQAQIVNWTINGVEQTLVDFTTIQSGHTLSIATTITVTGTWNATQLANLRGDLKSGGAVITENATLKTVDMSAAVWSEGARADYLFKNCKVLESVILPVADNANSISFMEAFSECTKLVSVANLDKFTNVSTFGRTFIACRALADITLPAGSSADTISFKETFYSCEVLPRVKNLDKFTQVSNFYNTFKNCPKLESITLSPTGSSYDGNVEFYQTFDGCTLLTRIENLEAFTGVANFAGAFRDCPNLLYVKLGVVPTGNSVNGFSRTNPNCLKYLPAGSTIPDKWSIYKNFIIDSKAQGDIALKDSCPYFCPEAFSMDGHMMSYTRDFTGKYGMWSTICLPFDAFLYVDEEVQFPFSSSTDTDGKYWLKYADEHTESSIDFKYVITGGVGANTPLIITLPAEMEAKGSVSFRLVPNLPIPATVDLSYVIYGGSISLYNICGTYTDLVQQPMYLISDDGMSFDYHEQADLHPFRACLIRRNSEQGASKLIIDETPTGIDGSVSADGMEIPAISRVYSVHGRLLRVVPAEEYEHRLDGLDRGIYIVNGVKEVVK